MIINFDLSYNSLCTKFDCTDYLDFGDQSRLIRSMLKDGVWSRFSVESRLQTNLREASETMMILIFIILVNLITERSKTKASVVLSRLPYPLEKPFLSIDRIFLEHSRKDQILVFQTSIIFTPVNSKIRSI